MNFGPYSPALVKERLGGEKRAKQTKTKLNIDITLTSYLPLHMFCREHSILSLHYFWRMPRKFLQRKKKKIIKYLDSRLHILCAACSNLNQKECCVFEDLSFKYLHLCCVCLISTRPGSQKMKLGWVINWFSRVLMLSSKQRAPLALITWLRTERSSFIKERNCSDPRELFLKTATSN